MSPTHWESCAMQTYAKPSVIIGGGLNTLRPGKENKSILPQFIPIILNKPNICYNYSETTVYKIQHIAFTSLKNT